MTMEKKSEEMSNWVQQAKTPIVNMKGRNEEGRGRKEALQVFGNGSREEIGMGRQWTFIKWGRQE